MTTRPPRPPCPNHAPHGPHLLFKNPEQRCPGLPVVTAGCFVPWTTPGIEVPAEGLTLHTPAMWLNADGTTSPVLPAAASASAPHADETLAADLADLIFAASREQKPGRWERNAAEAVLASDLLATHVRTIRAEALAPFVALADEWEKAASQPMPKRGPTESEGDQGVRIGVWDAVAKASRELRAALQQVGASDV